MSSISLTLKLLTVATIILRKDSLHRLNSNRVEFKKSYDFIVVGSGASGAIVANRLAENRHIRVLLLEAGGANGIPNDIPAEYVTLLNSQYDWNYTMAQQFVGVAFNGGRIAEDRGFVLGGSTSINGLVYNRGNRKGFDVWSQVFGAQGWSYEEVLPYFKKFENNTDPSIVGNDHYHGTRGPVQISSWPKPIDHIVLLQQKAVNELGIKTTDINGGQQVGTAITQAYINSRGVRSSTANAYLDPNPYPHNLHILTHAMVTRILFNGRTATGVEFVKTDVGQTFTVSARREVIVSAGAINSPQLLMLSGIGPRLQLEKFGIRLVVDLPVGENHQNHPALNINILIKEEYYNLINSGDSELTIDKLYEYYVNHSGVLTKYYNPITYFSTSSNADTDWPNGLFEAPVIKYTAAMEQSNSIRFGQLADKWKEYYREYVDKYYYSFIPYLERVKSFGFVRLQSKNPYIYPEINPQFLTHPQDFEDFVEITKFVFYFFERSSIAAYLKPHKPIPGCGFCPNQRYVYECDKYIRCFIQQITITGYHPVGTCRMGAIDRTDVVVDPRLRVKGISRLRVCDASIMPNITNSNTNAPALMIGEKCADMVKEDNRISRNI